MTSLRLFFVGGLTSYRAMFRRYGVPNRAALVCAAFRRAHLV